MRTGRAAEQFTLDRAAERLRGYLTRALPKAEPRRERGGQPRPGCGSWWPGTT